MFTLECGLLCWRAHPPAVADGRAVGSRVSRRGRRRLGREAEQAHRVADGGPGLGAEEGCDEEMRV